MTINTIPSNEELNYSTEPIKDSIEIHVYNDESIINNRLSTCVSCEYVTEERTCSLCDCPIVMMSQFNFKECPKGYWK